MKRVLKVVVRKFDPPIDTTPSIDLSCHPDYPDNWPPAKRFSVWGSGTDGEHIKSFASLKAARRFLNTSRSEFRGWPELSICEEVYPPEPREISPNVWEEWGPYKELTHEVRRNVGVFRKLRIPLDVPDFSSCVWPCECETEYLFDGEYGKIGCCCAGDRRRARRKHDAAWTARVKA